MHGKLFQRITRLYRLIAIFAASMSLIVAAIVVTARDQPATYRCLRFRDLASPNPFIYDLSTGYSAEDKRPLIQPQRTIYQLESPDGRYTAYTTEIAGTYPKLFIRSTDGSTPILIEDDVSVMYAMYWAANDAWFAYVWGPPFETGRGPELVIVKADGTNKRREMLLAGKHVSDFTAHNWSADGKYFMYTTEENSTLVYNFAALPYFNNVEVRRSNFLLAGPTWSREGHKLALLEFEDKPTGRLQWLTVLSADGGVETSVPLPPQMTSPQVLWSPNGTYIAVQYTNASSFMLDLYQADGTALGNITTNLSNQYGILNHIAWADDGTAILYLEQQAAPGFSNFVAYRPTDQRYDVISKDVIRLPFYPVENRRRIVLMRQEEGRTAVDLIDTRNVTRAVIVDGADDVGDPNWGPGGNLVAVAWATGQGKNRVVRLTWIGAVDSEPHTLLDGFSDVREFQWLDGGHKLAFVAVRGDKSDVEVVDTLTGEKQQLNDPVAIIGPLSVDSAGKRLYFPWQGEQGEAGIDVYDIDGRRISRFKTSGPIEGLMLMLSPDNRLAAIKLGPRGNESLEIASADGSAPMLIRTGLSGLGDPLWAPDSTKLAFTQSIQKGPATLEIVGADGINKARLDQYSGLYWELNWSTCD